MKKADKWTFAPDTVSVNGTTFPCSYSVSRSGDVYAFAVVNGVSIRLHIGQDMPVYSQALAAAKPATIAVNPAQPKAEPKPENPAQPKAEPKAEKPAQPKAEPKAEKPAQPKAEPKAEKPAQPKAEPKAEKPAQPKAEPKPEKPWIGTTIVGNGWNIAFDPQTDRTRVLFQNQPTVAQKAAIDAAGFYWSPTMQSFNKKLTNKAYKAAQVLAVALNALA